MEVILLQDVEKLGLRGEVVDVARGLRAQLPAPAQARRGGDARQGRRAARARGEAARATRRRAVEQAQEIAQKLEDAELRFDVKAGETGHALRLGHRDRHRRRALGDAEGPRRPPQDRPARADQADRPLPDPDRALRRRRRPRLRVARRARGRRAAAARRSSRRSPRPRPRPRRPRQAEAEAEHEPAEAAIEAVDRRGRAGRARGRGRGRSRAGRRGRGRPSRDAEDELRPSPSRAESQQSAQLLHRLRPRLWRFRTKIPAPSGDSPTGRRPGARGNMCSVMPANWPHRL